MEYLMIRIGKMENGKWKMVNLGVFTSQGSDFQSRRDFLRIARQFIAG
ncbi:hypothetical protein QUF80_06695 [Desulfococcaceae bacterium HSG8]|nr:hypothetical protein [Desulfococcaceae bacterium HSG8]